MTTTETVSLYDLIHTCIVSEQPMVVLYAPGGETDKASVLYPSRLATTTTGADVIRAHDSLSNETKSFRVDRILSAHHLTA